MLKRKMPPSSTRPSAWISTLSESPRCQRAGAICKAAPPSAQRGGALGVQLASKVSGINDSALRASARLSAFGCADQVLEQFGLAGALAQGRDLRPAKPAQFEDFSEDALDRQEHVEEFRIADHVVHLATTCDHP